jgi:hypothetical protein
MRHYLLLLHSPRTGPYRRSSLRYASPPDQSSPLEQLALHLTAGAACATPHRWSSLLYTSPLEQLALHLTAGAACATPHRWSSLRYTLPLEKRAQYSTSDQITASVPDQPTCQLTGMVSQGPSSPSQSPRPAIYEVSFVILRSTVLSLLLGLECTSITAEQKICQTTSINIRTYIILCNQSSLTLPEINIQSSSVHT